MYVCLLTDQVYFSSPKHGDARKDAREKFYDRDAPASENKFEYYWNSLNFI